MDNNTSSQPTVTAIHTQQWRGSIPVVVTLAPTSLSSPTMPPPIHILVSRQTYLHVALRDVVVRLHRFAPTLPRRHDIRQNEQQKQQQQQQSHSSTAVNAETTHPSTTAMMIRRSEPEPGQHRQQHQQQLKEGLDDDDDAELDVSHQPTTTTAQTPYPVCWFEDEDSQRPLPWHVFAGVLFDWKATSSPSTSSTSSSSSLLPWKIRLHFTGYPQHQILPLQESPPPSSSSSTPHPTNTATTTTTTTTDHVMTQIMSYYKQSLKQALCCQTGTAKAALHVTKEAHGLLQDAILQQPSNYALHQQAMLALPRLPDRASHLHWIPIRLWLIQYHEHDDAGGRGGGQPAAAPIQKACRPWQAAAITQSTTQPQQHVDSSSNNGNVNNNTKSTMSYAEEIVDKKLGDLLVEWLPQHFHRELEEDEQDEVPAKIVASDNSHNTNLHTRYHDKNNSGNNIIDDDRDSPVLVQLHSVIRPNVTVRMWYIAGIQPTLTMPLWELWTYLHHPDHFLYITVHVNVL